MPPRAQFDQPQQTWLVLEFHKRRSKNKKISFLPQLIADFLTEFPNARVPSFNAIRNMFGKLIETGTVLNLNSEASPGEHSGRPRTVRTEANKQQLKVVLDRDATKRIGEANRSPVNSARKNSLFIKKSSFSRLVSDLKYHPYKAVRRHALQPGDLEKRRRFCGWFLQLTDAEQARFLVSDEANFQLGGHVNSKNIVRYSLNRHGRPDQHVVEKVAFSAKLMVFCGIREGGTFGLTVYRNTNMNGGVYNTLLVTSVLPQLRQINGGDLQGMFWQQDGAPCKVI